MLADDVARLNADAERQTTFVLYGVPVDVPGDGGAADEVVVLYHGLAVAGVDVRQPSGRLFSLPRAEILNEEPAESYGSGRTDVRSYELPLTAAITEASTRAVSVDAELAVGRSATLAGLVSTPPRPPAVDMAELESLSHEELLQRARDAIALASTLPRLDGGGVLLAACSTYSQTYTATSWLGGLLSFQDEWGGDCDSNAETLPA